MKIEVPKIVRPVDLGDYTEEMRGQIFYVWVNPRGELLQEFFSLQDSIISGTEEKTLESQAARMREILSELLSQGPQELRWTTEEISALIDTGDTDPQLYPWVVNQVFEKIGEHRVRRKKA